MKRIIATIAFALVAAGPGGLAAQARGRPPATPGPGEIRGMIVDAETRAPVPSASVEVRSGADSALVTGAIGRPDGTFRIEGLRPGAYYLRVTMIGYQTQRTPALVVAESAPRVSAGSIVLVRAPVAVAGVEVEAARAMVIAPDRNAYRARDVAPAAATASDVLEAVPSVQVDADGKVSLRGNENVVVQINGRPTPIRGEQLAAYLRQLPANTIERVEVIPNPSARQDPEGMAGILNIVLKQTVDLGRSGGFTLSGSTADRYTLAGNLGYQGGPATLLFTYGFNSDDRSVTGINDRTRLGLLRAPISFTDQDIAGTVRNRGHNVNANVDYRLSARDVLFAHASLNRRSGRDESLSAYAELDGERTLLERYDRLRDFATDPWTVDASVGFRRTMKPQRHEVSAEVRFSRQDEPERTELWREPAAGGAAVDVEVDELEALTRQLTTQVDYTRALGEALKLEAGYKGTSRWLDRDFLVRTDPLGTGEWTTSDLSNALEFDERVDAVYGVLSQRRGRVELQAGLRAEYAQREFSLEGGASYPHDYRSLFPSGLISYRPNDKTQAKLSYSRRIRRPGPSELNPFPAFFDLQNVFLGNPALAPEYTDAIELGLQRSGAAGSIQLSPFFRRTTNVIRVDINTADTIAGREVTTVSFKNLDTSTSWGADLNGQFQLGKAFRGLASFNVFKVVTDGGSESNLSSDAVTWMARVNGMLTLRPTTTLQAAYFYRAPMNIERGRFAAVSSADLTVRQKLRGDRLSASLRLTDPFNTSRFRVQAGDDNVVQLTQRAFNTRAVHLTIQATFGQTPRVREPRPDDEARPQTGFPR